jgi:uncharacterized membrane protein HdeD (DUF308 family)
MDQIIDYAALALGILIAAAITLVLMRAHRGENSRRGWITAGVVAAILLAIGIIDLMAAPRRELPLATVIVGATLPVLGAVGMIHATRRVRPWVRWIMVYVTTLLLLFIGLLIGATAPSRLIPF